MWDNGDVVQEAVTAKENCKDYVGQGHGLMQTILRELLVAPVCKRAKSMDSQTWVSRMIVIYNNAVQLQATLPKYILIKHI